MDISTRGRGARCSGNAEANINDSHNNNNNNKRPDGLTLIPWQGGKSLTWDVTVVSTVADSYLHSTSRSAKAACVRKESKYSTLPSDLIFQPVAMETHGRFSECIGSELPQRGWPSVELLSLIHI